MKKIFSVMFGVLVLASIASANPLLCPTSNNPAAFSDLLSYGSTGCEAGDYLFTNFTLASGNPDTRNLANVTASFSFESSGNTVTFNLNDTAHFISQFTLTYDVALDQTQPPANVNPGNWNIIAATAGLQDNIGFPPSDNATWVKMVNATVGTGSGSETVTDVNGVATPSGAIYPLAASLLAVTDTFTIPNVGNGAILNLSNIYYQNGPAAEPSTMVLLGFALIGLGVFVRKRRKACA